MRRRRTGEWERRREQRVAAASEKEDPPVCQCKIAGLGGAIANEKIAIRFAWRRRNMGKGQDESGREKVGRDGWTKKGKREEIDNSRE